MNAEDKAVSDIAARSEAEIGHLLVLWGVPGAGKSTFARWLEKDRGFQHIDTDAFTLEGPTTNLARAWGDVLGRGVIEEFVEVAAVHRAPVTVEYGLYANAPAFALLGRLRELGAEPWWFDGERAAAKEAWRHENRKSRPQFDDAAWDRVVSVIDANWHLVEGFFGARILRTIEAGRRHVPTGQTYEAMVAIRARASS